MNQYAAVDQPLLPIAKGALAQAGSSSADHKAARRIRFIAAAKRLCCEFDPTRLSRLDLGDRHPGSRVSGPIETTIRRLLIALAILILAAAILRPGLPGA